MTYHRPENADAVYDLKNKFPQAVYLAGGTQVNRAPLDRARPQTVIDLRKALGNGATLGNKIIIGAMVTLQELSDLSGLPQALRDAAGFIPTRSVRNQATIGGNIGAGRPDSYVIPALIALGAIVQTRGGEMSVEKYINSDCKELIESILTESVPAACAAVKESRSHLALPVVSAAVSLEGEGGKIKSAVVAAGCVAAKTIRLTDVEKALQGGLSGREEIEAVVKKSIDPQNDLLGSAEYKKHINAVRITDAILECLEAIS